MKITAKNWKNKKFTTRSGLKVLIKSFDPDCIYKLMGIIIDHGVASSKQSWTTKGEFIRNEENDLDLVEIKSKSNMNKNKNQNKEIQHLIKQVDNPQKVRETLLKLIEEAVIPLNQLVIGRIYKIKVKNKFVVARCVAKYILGNFCSTFDCADSLCLFSAHGTIRAILDNKSKVFRASPQEVQDYLNAKNPQ